MWKSRATYRGSYRLRWLTYWPKNPKKHISTFQTFLRKIVKFSNFEKSFLVMWFLIKNKPYSKIFSSLYITCVTCRDWKSQHRAYFSCTESHDQNHFRSPKILHFIGVKSEINHSKMTFLEQRLKKWSFILDVIWSDYFSAANKNASKLSSKRGTLHRSEIEIETILSLEILVYSEV